MRICVFCASTLGNSELYANAAREMGRTLAGKGIELIYGGGRVGLMGVLADAALSTGGTVVGVMPQALVERQIQHTSLTTLHIVASMHERKTLMAEPPRPKSRKLHGSILSFRAISSLRH